MDQTPVVFRCDAPVTDCVQGWVSAFSLRTAKPQEQSKSEGYTPCHPPRRSSAASLTRFHRRSPANMKPLLVTKSDPTMLIAVDRLPENTNPET